MTDFVPGRAQDAAPTVRGFVYQTDVTILRWLELADDESLELECGEDIDLVAQREGSTDEAERLRLLGLIELVGGDHHVQPLVDLGDLQLQIETLRVGVGNQHQALAAGLQRLQKIGETHLVKLTNR